MVAIVSLNRVGLFLLSKMVPRGPSHLKERQQPGRVGQNMRSVLQGDLWPWRATASKLF